MNAEKRIENAYLIAKEQFAEIGVDCDKVLKEISKIRISLHCWQGDDVAGFEKSGKNLSDGGIQVTGAYPGKARNPEELRQDLSKALSLIPGKHKVNLHAIYAECGAKTVERDELDVSHFANWISWARKNSLGLDFNPTFFAHKLASDGFTLSSGKKNVREFWIRHARQCRKISNEFGKKLGVVSVNNIWIPDGYKDTPFSRLAPRQRLIESLDAILEEPMEKKYTLDAVESKLFGIGSESYVTGSHEFYLAYALRKNILLCLDTGHFHPTETISDKISSLLLFLDGLLLHVSRGIRWDSDHVVAYTDDLRAISEEIVRGSHLAQVHLGLDYFDASINRIAAWTVGARNLLKSLLAAMLEPAKIIRQMENEGNYTARLALLEDAKLAPVGAVWNFYCATKNVPPDSAWMKEVEAYEKNVLSLRQSS